MTDLEKAIAIWSAMDYEAIGVEGKLILEAAQAHADSLRNGGWLPIETAPKDGTEILIWDYEVYKAKYTQVGANGEMGWATQHFWADEEGRGFTSFSPTDWQPLLPPPTQPTEKDEK